jgi:hypothetical protein
MSFPMIDFFDGFHAKIFKKMTDSINGVSIDPLQNIEEKWSQFEWFFLHRNLLSHLIIFNDTTLQIKM